MTEPDFIRPTQALAEMIANGDYNKSRVIRANGVVHRELKILVFPRIQRPKKNWWRRTKVVLELIDLTQHAHDANEQKYSLVLWDGTRNKAIPYSEDGHIEYNINSKISLKEIEVFIQHVINNLETNTVSESTLHKFELASFLVRSKQAVVEHYGKIYYQGDGEEGQESEEPS